ncbi:E3.1.11.2 [Mytilus coruscus]|uniref:exodeoxyribonuclease III n=1 Tax=Mytilus coruscus TaxID=42192 RepID=A0A6J8BGS5_MYTCO|nr:E3.1.11.2 [Mytilus coruscus]
MDNHIKKFSMNVRGLFSSAKKRSDVFNWAKSKSSSIVCFQETHSTRDIETLWGDEWGHQCYFGHGDSRNAGVCVMFRGGYDYEIHESLIDQHGRYIILNLTLYDQRLTLVCLYGYNTDKPEFFCDILQKTMRFSNTSFIFLGDWNVVQDKNDDTYNVIHDRNPNSRKKIDEIKETLLLLDPWRTCYPSDRKFTWRQTSPIKQSRLDYYLVSENLFTLVESTKIIPEYRTDHSAIILTFTASLAKAKDTGNLILSF